MLITTVAQEQAISRRLQSGRVARGRGASAICGRRRSDARGVARILRASLSPDSRTFVRQQTQPEGE
jgi:hypothetical protein